MLIRGREKYDKFYLECQENLTIGWKEVWAPIPRERTVTGGDEGLVNSSPQMTDVLQLVEDLGVNNSI